MTLCPSAELSSSPACKGYEPEYAATSNALCVTRSECEALCDEVEGCSSFDMHATKPRCFLNSAYCAPGANPYSGSTAALLGQKDIYEASNDYDFVYTDIGKVNWSTASDESCGAGDGTPDGIPASVAISVEGTKYSCGLKCGALHAELAVIPSFFPLAAALGMTYAEYLFGDGAAAFNFTDGTVKGDFSFLDPLTTLPMFWARCRNCRAGTPSSKQALRRRSLGDSKRMSFGGEALEDRRADRSSRTYPTLRQRPPATPCAEQRAARWAHHRTFISILG